MYKFTKKYITFIFVFSIFIGAMYQLIALKPLLLPKLRRADVLIINAQDYKLVALCKFCKILII